MKELRKKKHWMKTKRNRQRNRNRNASNRANERRSYINKEKKKEYNNSNNTGTEVQKSRTQRISKTNNYISKKKATQKAERHARRLFSPVKVTDEIYTRHRETQKGLKILKSLNVENLRPRKVTKELSPMTSEEEEEEEKVESEEEEAGT